MMWRVVLCVAPLTFFFPFQSFAVFSFFSLLLLFLLKLCSFSPTHISCLVSSSRSVSQLIPIDCFIMPTRCFVCNSHVLLIPSKDSRKIGLEWRMHANVFMKNLAHRLQVAVLLVSIFHCENKTKPRLVAKSNEGHQSQGCFTASKIWFPAMRNFVQIAIDLTKMYNNTHTVSRAFQPVLF